MVLWQRNIALTRIHSTFAFCTGCDSLCMLVWHRGGLAQHARSTSSSLVTAEEAARLEKILSRFPTSEAQDEALLQEGSLGERERVFVRFRVLRKRALRQTAARIRAALVQSRSDAEL